MRMRLLNLHDAFLNASLQRHAMLQEPVEGPATFDVSNRGRFERTWAAFLYVLLEAWESKSAEPVRRHLTSLVNLSELNSILGEGRIRLRQSLV